MGNHFRSPQSDRSSVGGRLIAAPTGGRKVGADSIRPKNAALFPPDAKTTACMAVVLAEKELLFPGRWEGIIKETNYRFFPGMKKEDIQAQGVSLPVYPLYHSLKALLLRRPGHVPGSLQSVVHKRYIDLKVSPRVGRPGDCFIGFRPQRNLPFTSSDPYVIGGYTIPWMRRICQGKKKEAAERFVLPLPGTAQKRGEVTAIISSCLP